MIYGISQPLVKTNTLMGETLRIWPKFVKINPKDFKNGLIENNIFTTFIQKEGKCKCCIGLCFLGKVPK